MEKTINGNTFSPKDLEKKSIIWKHPRTRKGLTWENNDNTDQDITIYTDGSKIEQRVGSANMVLLEDKMLHRQDSAYYFSYTSFA